MQWQYYFTEINCLCSEGDWTLCHGCIAFSCTVCYSSASKKCWPPETGFFKLIQPNSKQSSFIVSIIQLLFEVWSILFCFDGMVYLEFIASLVAGGRLLWHQTGKQVPNELLQTNSTNKQISQELKELKAHSMQIAVKVRNHMLFSILLKSGSK